MKRDAENVHSTQAEMVENISKQKTRFLWSITIIALIGIGFCASTIVFAIKLKNSYPSSHVKYHVWGHSNPLQATRNKHNNLKVPKNSTMFITMEHASLEDSHFRFEYVQYEFGKFVKSIGGISEDVPNNKFWILYELNEDPDPNNPPTSDQMSEEGVDDLRVEHNKVYLFWLTQFTIEEGMALLKNRLASNCQSTQKVTEL